MECQIKFWIPNGIYLFIFIRQKSTLDIRHSGKLCSTSILGKSLKIKFKPLKELEWGTPQKDVASLFSETKNTLSAWKKKKNLPLYENSFGPKRLKQEKCEAL